MSDSEVTNETIKGEDVENIERKKQNISIRRETVRVLAVTGRKAQVTKVPRKQE